MIVVGTERAGDCFNRVVRFLRGCFNQGLDGPHTPFAHPFIVPDG